MHTMRVSSVPDACAIDTLRLSVLSALVKKSTRPMYINPMWEKCVTSITVMHVILMTMLVVLS